MRDSVWRLVQALTAVFAIACAPTAKPADTQADEAAINAVREREMSFVNSGNVDSLVSVYATDIQMMPPNEPAVSGRDALRRWVDTTFKQVTMSGQYTSSVVTVSGDLAVDRYAGTLTITPKAGGAPMTEQIKGVHVMRREADGTWSIVQDVWNPDAPPPAPAAPPAPTKK